MTFGYKAYEAKARTKIPEKQMNFGNTQVGQQKEAVPGRRKKREKNMWWQENRGQKKSEYLKK